MASLSVLNILRTIKDRGTVSRTDLQQSTGLSWGTITNTTRDLLHRGLIREEGSTSTRAGRKPVRLAINPLTHGIIGLEVGAGVLRCQLLNLAGDSLGYEETGFDLAAPAAGVVDLGWQMILRALALPIMAGRNCLGVGVALPGTLDDARGVLRFSRRLPGWKDVAVGRLLQDRSGLAVRLERAGNCLALAERWFGQAGQADDVLCLNLGEVVEMGILLGGEVFRGSGQMAGEFGHTTLDPEGPACACGDRGCVEAYAAVGAVREYVRSLKDMPVAGEASVMAGGLPTLAAVLAAAAGGDPAARAALARAGRALGLGIANLIDLFNPYMIALAGIMTDGREWIVPALEGEVKLHAGAEARCPVVISQLGERAVAMGACGIVLQSIFDPAAVPAAELQHV